MPEGWVRWRMTLLVLVTAAIGVADCSSGGAATPPGASAPGSTPAAIATGSTGPTSSPTATPDPALDPAALAWPGPYGVGVRTYAFVDPRRENRPVAVHVWYPAVAPPGKATPDAAPEPEGGPYPVILGSENISAFLGEHLASHGFAFLAVDGQDTWSNHPDPAMVDFPLDLVAALDGLEGLDDDPLTGVIDTDRAGVADYSFGAWSALMLSGARIDPDHYRATCATRPAGWSDQWFDYICGSPANWDAFVKRGTEAGVAPATGMWTAFGDERIRAVVPMMPEGFDLVGEGGIASAHASALLIAGSNDLTNDYFPAAVSLFEAYPAGRVSMVTFVDASHFLILREGGLLQIRRLTTAFFMARLGGNEAAADLLAPPWIEGEASTLEPHEAYRTLVWGAVEPPGG